MVILVRGTHGTGKSTLLRAFLADLAVLDTVDNVGLFTKKKPRRIKYVLSGDVAIMGNYEHPTSGGLDGMTPIRHCWDLLTDAGRDHAFALGESVMMSNAKSRVVALADALGRDQVVSAQLDTPFEVALERIYARNGGKPVKEDVIKYHHKRTNDIHRWLRDEGVCRTLTLDHEHAYLHLTTFMYDHGWRPE